MTNLQKIKEWYLYGARDNDLSTIERKLDHYDETELGELLKRIEEKRGAWEDSEAANPNHITGKENASNLN